MLLAIVGGTSACLGQKNMKKKKKLMLLPIPEVHNGAAWRRLAIIAGPASAGKGYVGEEDHR